MRDNLEEVEKWVWRVLGKLSEDLKRASQDWHTKGRKRKQKAIKWDLNEVCGEKTGLAYRMRWWVKTNWSPMIPCGITEIMQVMEHTTVTKNLSNKTRQQWRLLIKMTNSYFKTSIFFLNFIISYFRTSIFFNFIISFSTIVLMPII